MGKNIKEDAGSLTKINNRLLNLAQYENALPVVEDQNGDKAKSKKVKKVKSQRRRRGRNLLVVLIVIAPQKTVMMKALKRRRKRRQRRKRRRKKRRKWKISACLSLRKLQRRETRIWLRREGEGLL